MTVPVTPPAQRARTILALSPTVAMARGEARTWTEWPVSRVVLAPAPTGTPAGERCVIEVADAAPVAVRERIRGRVRIVGHVQDGGPDGGPDGGCDALHVAVAGVLLEEAGVQVRVALDDLLQADPDPLAGCEASVLAHLTAAHDDVLRVLVRLVDADDLHGVVTVWPLRLDRLGIVLRLEHVRGHRDRRLDFDVPLTSADQLTAAMTLLIARARGRVRRPCAASREGRPPGGGPLDAILRASAAARRLCSPSDPAA